MSDVIRHVTITGRVQGVGYRAWLDFGAGWLDWRGVQRVSAT